MDDESGELMEPVLVMDRLGAHAHPWLHHCMKTLKFLPKGHQELIHK